MGRACGPAQVGVVSAAFQVGAKGRVVLPVAVRRAARIDEGAELVARPIGEGQLLLETKDAVRARVWSATPDAGSIDATADVRALRSEDIAVEQRSAARRSIEASTEHSAAAGAALLAHLGQ